MKELFSILAFLLMTPVSFSQLAKIAAPRQDTKLEICLSRIEETDNLLSVDQVINLMDSLQAEETRKMLQQNPITYDSKGNRLYSIGEKAQGGIVYWLNKDRQHGLVAYEEDQASEVTFIEGVTSALKGDSIHCGKYNTERIISNKSVGYLAAKICADFMGGGYDDWYLPSKYELSLLYTQYANRKVFNFARDYYWSSSEDINDVAWLVRFYDGQIHNYKRYGSTSFRVRAVRSF